MFSLAVALVLAVPGLVPDPASAGEVTTTARVDTFVLIGVSFAGGDVPEGATVSVHEPGSGWGPEIALTGGEHGPDPGSAEAATAATASDPIWVGEADAYRVRAPGLDDDEEVVVHTVSEDDSAVQAQSEPPPEAGTEAASDVTARFWWGAAPYRGTPSYSSGLDRAVIHHTVSANGYGMNDVPAMLRAIQAYHQDVNGWDDIGYNFVVDRFGRTWEGRAGSIERATVGAHTAGSNSRSIGIAFLGDGRLAAPDDTVRAAGQLLAWKLPRHGTTARTGNVLGHRDLNATACPGELLYDELDAIVARAQGADRPSRPGPDNHIRRRSQAAFGGQNVYNGTGAGQSRTTRVRRGGRATFFVRVENDAATRQRFVVRGTPSSRRFDVRYLAGDQGISRSVEAGSYRVDLDPGRTRVIRVVVDATAASRKGTKRTFAVTTRSAALDTGDTVKATVRRR